MKKMMLFIACVLTVGSLNAQNLKKAPRSKEDISNKVWRKYEDIGKVDGGVWLILYANKRYRYHISTTNYNAFSNGSWDRVGMDLFLTSDYDSTNIPITTECLSEQKNSENSKTKSIFPIPVNMKGELLSDSRVYINNDSSYCFPFFDTCINSTSSIDSIRVDFGSGFKSRWVTINKTKCSQIAITANIDFELASYLVFKKLKYKIVGSILK